jgi:DNA-binding LacI/PurR family transcriptional regulator
VEDLAQHSICLLLEQMEHHQEPHYETVPATLIRKESSQAVE